MIFKHIHVTRRENPNRHWHQSGPGINSNKRMISDFLEPQLSSITITYELFIDRFLTSLQLVESLFLCLEELISLFIYICIFVQMILKGRAFFWLIYDSKYSYLILIICTVIRFQVFLSNSNNMVLSNYLYLINSLQSSLVL